MASKTADIPDLSDDQLRRLRAAIRSSPKFAAHPDAFFETPLGAKQLEDHVSGRYEKCLRRIVPWVARKINLAEASVVEIGCGTGSTTAAFARRARSIDAFDINDRSFPAAQERLSILGLDNARLFAGEPGSFAREMALAHPNGVDVVLLYAVMEHQTLSERLETLETWWPMLRPGGVLVVSDTPNRLVYRHGHTSRIPFFDMVPDELALRFVEQSPRPAFARRMRDLRERSLEEARAALDRWGRGVSFHEFAAVLGDLRELVVGDGFEPDILAFRQVVLEERLLLAFLEAECPEVPIGFARRSLDLILQKPIPGQAPGRPDHDASQLTALRLLP